jgi:hypothetical protein
MKSLKNWARKPVAREYAAGYLRLTIFSFALTVALTRLFLSATGYPQLGSHILHIAHLLWGGLALFIGALLMLIVANRWAYRVGAVLTGVGVGLFIDEVGKFITRTNDYFYPPAAPIIYTFFLLVLLLYLELRRPPAHDARSELYRVFDDLQEVLDRDLDAHEQAALKERLHHIVGEAPNPDLARLAEELLHFIDSDAVYLIPHVPGWQERGLNRLRTFADRRLTRRRLKAGLVGGLGVLGAIAAINLFQWLLALQSPADVTHMLADLVAVGRLGGPQSLVWLVLHIALKAASGLLLLVAAGCLILGFDKRGIQLGYLGLLLSLTVVDLMEFYFSQFSAIVPAAVQFGLLLTMLQYRRRYSNHPLFSGFSR